MTGARRPAAWRVGPAAVVLLTAAAIAPARAAVKLTPGQEFLYSGTAEWKVSGGGGPGQALTGSVQLSALVTEADPAKGYAVILLRRFDPKVEAGQPQFPADAGVGTVRYTADLAATQPPTLSGSPISAILQAITVPVSPKAELKAGLEWRQSEPLPGLPPRPVEVVYTVTGETKVGERAGLKIEKKLAQALPYKQELGGASLELTEYSQTVSVDPETGQVLADQVHGRARFTAPDRQVNLEFGADVTLKEARQLPEAELAARVKQAATIDRVEHAMFVPTPGADRGPALASAAKEIAGFKTESPTSPYAPVVTQLDEILGQMRSQEVREARSQSLKGKPAPTFALKSLAGKQESLAAYRGKIVVLNFFTSSNPLCEAAAPYLEKAFWQKYRGRGVVIVGVNTGEQGQQAQLARRFRDKHALTYPILLDAGDQIAAKYGVAMLPTSVVIDRKGTVRMLEAGFNPPGLDGMLNSLLKTR